MQKAKVIQPTYKIKLNSSQSLPQQRIYLNPETQNLGGVEKINHLNPVSHNKKPFLSKVKERAINSQYYKAEIPMRTQSLNEKDNSSIHMSPDKSANPHKIHHQLQKQIQNISYVQRVVYPKEDKRQGYNTMVPRIQHVIEDQNKFLKDEVIFLKEKLQMSEQNFQKQIEKVYQKDNQIQQKNKIIDDKNQQLNKLRDIERSYNQLLEKYQLLKFDNDCNKKQINNLEQENINLIDQCSQFQITLKLKDQKHQSIIQSKNSQHLSAIRFKDNQINILTKRIDILERQNMQLKQQINNLGSNKCQHKSQIKEDKFYNLSKDFQKSINEAIDENSRLKNIISQQEGKIQELKIQNNSYQSIIKAFEERDNLEKGLKTFGEIQYLREMNEKQKQEHDIQISQLQLQILKLENQIQTRKYAEKIPLIQEADQFRLLQNFTCLLNEVESLREMLKNGK